MLGRDAERDAAASPADALGLVTRDHVASSRAYNRLLPWRVLNRAVPEWLDGRRELSRGIHNRTVAEELNRGGSCPGVFMIAPFPNG